jgi:transcriptional regulator with XRE-family HTH domain
VITLSGRREWLKNIRVGLDLTQQEVAEAVGIERSTYAMYESGRRNPHVVTAQGIATFLKFEWTFFFTENSGMKQQNQKPA